MKHRDVAAKDRKSLFVKPHYATDGQGGWWMMTDGVLFQGPTMQVCWTRYMTWCWDRALMLDKVFNQLTKWQSEQTT